jgi:uncharacterized protein (UPF0332 family)
MPFDWAKFLELAERLAQEPNEEAKRTSISRAYYYAFNAAYERAQTTAGLRPQGVKYHDWCWGKYRATNNVICQRIADFGERMRGRRTHADYRAREIPKLNEEVVRMLEDARTFAVTLTRLDPTHPLP